MVFCQLLTYARIQIKAMNKAIKNIFFVLFFLFFNNAVYSDIQVNIERVGEPIAHPWGVSQIDGSHYLVTARSGELFKVDINTGQHQPISNVPAVFAKRQGGLLDVGIENSTVYLCYSRPMPDGKAATALYRAELAGNALQGGKVLFTSNFLSTSGHHFGCRIVLVEDFIYLALGERGERDTAQDNALYSGAVIRLTKEGHLAPASGDNWPKGVFTKGHRNPQGMARHLRTGEIWLHEHGPKGGDEINILQAGANYGWPIVSHGREYYGGKVGEGLTKAEGFADPAWVWIPSIAPSGMAFYDRDMFPELKGGLLVGSLKFRSLYHLRLEGEKPASEEVILKQQIGRIRDVMVAEDGAILLLSDEVNGGLYRLSRD